MQEESAGSGDAPKMVQEKEEPKKLLILSLGFWGAGGGLGRRGHFLRLADLFTPVTASTRVSTCARTPQSHSKADITNRSQHTFPLSLGGPPSLAYPARQLPLGQWQAFSLELE